MYTLGQLLGSMFSIFLTIRIILLLFLNIIWLLIKLFCLKKCCFGSDATLTLTQCLLQINKYMPLSNTLESKKYKLSLRNVIEWKYKAAEDGNIQEKNFNIVP